VRGCILAFVVIACAFSIANAGEIELPHVTVYGTATTQVVPDQLIWSLHVQNKAMGIEDVAKIHADEVQQVLRFLKDAKIDEADTQSSGMRFGENWERRGESQVKEGYTAGTDISFRAKDTSNYRALWLGLAKFPHVTVEGVYYDSSERIARQDETRGKAVLAAKEKASGLAKTIGAEIGEPLLIEEDVDVSRESGPGGNNVRFVEAQPPGTNEDAIAPGRIPIRARVKVSFRLVSAGR
jgi:uncharacterized protein